MMNKNGQLFLSFLKIGAFTFGGGYAMIPLMEHEIVEKRNWISEEDVVNMVAIAESTPGVMAVNFATYVGYKIGKFWGSLLATLGVVLPSFIAIILISLFLNAFQNNIWIQNFLLGVKAGVVVLLFKAVIKLTKTCKKGLLSYIIVAIFLLIALFTSVPVIILLLGGAILGIVHGFKMKKTIELEGEHHD